MANRLAENGRNNLLDKSKTHFDSKRFYLCIDKNNWIKKLRYSNLVIFNKMWAKELYVCTHILCVCVCIYIYIYINVCVCEYIYMCVCVCVYGSKYENMYVCVYIYIYIYI